MRKNFWLFILLSFLLIVLFVLDIFTGNADISFKDGFNALFSTSGNEITDEIIFNYRLPKAITALIAGSALSVAGLLMQTLFRNPLAGPDVLGISSGAGLGVALLTLLNGTVIHQIIAPLGSMAQVIAAIAGASLTLLLVLAVSVKIKDTVTILVLGMIFGYVAGSAITILQSFANPDALKVFVTWTFGSLGAITWNKMPLFVILTVIGICITFLMQKTLNSLLLGNSYASSIGLNIKRTQLVVITITSVITGTVTAYTGPIAFIGVAMPHFARALFGTVNHKTIIPATILTGSILMLVCDIVSQLPVSNRTLPINAVTAIFGAPMIVWIILKRKKL